jgi:hypothetical protein
VYIGDWGLAMLNIQSPALMHANNKLDKRIGYLTKRRKEAEDMGICTKKIDAEFQKVVFRNLCHFSIIKKTGVTHDSIFRLQQSIS